MASAVHADLANVLGLELFKRASSFWVFYMTLFSFYFPTNLIFIGFHRSVVLQHSENSKSVKTKNSGSSSQIF